MPPSRPNHRRSLRWQYLLLALVLTVAVYAVDLYLFDYREPAPPPPTPEAEDYAEFIFVPLDEPLPEHGFDEARRDYTKRLELNLTAWIESFDPSILSRPNEEFGFSSVRREEFRRPLQELPPIPIAFQPAADWDDPATRLSPDTYDWQAHQTAERRLRPPPLQPSVRPDRPPPPPAVFWTDPAGALVTGLPTAIADDLPPHEGARVLRGPTVLRVLPVPRPGRGLLLRVEVRQSCGDPALDQLLQARLHSHFLPAAEALAAEESQWQPRTFVGHWHFLPGIVIGQPPDGHPDEGAPHEGFSHALDRF